ncbi:MAG TPA: hypothetical protein VIH72_09000 [Candidatus Acidoferrales bacterium]|jgi:hypothetical protein
MRKNGWKSVVAVLALVMMVSPAFAKPISRVITMAADQKIAGKQLNHDDYTFVVDDTKLVVELHHKVVAEVTGKWEPRDRKYDGNTVVSGADGQILEVRFSGEKRAFVIGSM